jgi:hypothetical protein
LYINDENYTNIIDHIFTIKKLLKILYISHDRLKSKLYLPALTVVCFSLSSFQLYAFLNNNVGPAFNIIGTFADFLQQQWYNVKFKGDARTVVRMIAFPLYCITIMCYILVGIYLIYKRGKKINSIIRDE